MQTLEKLYSVQRSIGWRAQSALRNAKTLWEWDALNGWIASNDDAQREPRIGWNEGVVRLITLWDKNPDTSFWTKEEYKLAESDGCFGLVGQFWDGDDWQDVDSCWGFIGEQWLNSGYDTDIMSATIEAYRKHVQRFAFSRRERPYN